MKKCSKCKRTKHEDEFTISKRYKDGLCSWCKKCAAKYIKDKRKNDPKYAEYVRKYREDPEHREHKNKLQRNKYKNDPEYRQYNEDYREEHRDHCNKLQRNKYKNDPKYREDILERKRNKYNEDIEFRSRAHARQKANYLGIAPDEYLALRDNLIEKQNGKCAICDQHMSEVNLVVDHDHNTGKIRGLLCGRCNVGIGYFRDDKDLLKRAAKYLKEV